MLRKIRTMLAAVFLFLATMLFVDLSGVAARHFAWVAKVQFLPALLSLNVLVVAALLLLTLVFGRIYCSVVCPLGVMQDVFAFFGRLRKKNPYRFSKERRWLRYGVLAVFVILIIFGVNALYVLVAPYSAFGRIAATIVRPVYAFCNNVFAYFSELTGSYVFSHEEICLSVSATLIIALVTLILLGILAWRGGRTYCNTICPVGTVLGFFARFSLLKVHILEEKCISCGKCGRHCKAACLDSKNHAIDYSRCVVCGDCLGECHEKALVYGLRRGKKEETSSGPMDKGRRAFLVGATISTAAALFAQDKKTVDGGLAVIEDKVAPQRKTPVHPAGSLSARHLRQHCTACQLCIAECPNHVLRPSTDLRTFMQPEMSFERGSCKPFCNRCSAVCPTGAIRPISLEDKVSTQLGHAVWIEKNCVVTTDGVQCFMCSRVCPAGAITLVAKDVSDENSLKVPAVDTAKCIGCGACENMCPSRPLSAIYVEGHEVHKLI
ncbi:MAG: 4Fe-4S dicluster domain-containing protein [Prevotella sp.]|nr:4Fe-4S dicluster domain-containing protein [Prevotella sp.]